MSVRGMNEPDHTYTVLASPEDRPGWLAARMPGVTTSDIVRLAHGTEGTADVIRAEKAARIEDPPRLVSDEEVARVLRGAKYDLPPYGLLISADDDPNFLAAPDAVHAGRVAHVAPAGDWTEETLPVPHRDALQWTMRVTGARRGVVLFDHNGSTKSIDVEYDEERVAFLEEVAYAFLTEADEGGDPQ
jgi:hypothetical protein